MQGVFTRLQEVIHVKYPDMCMAKDWVLLYDNAPAHHVPVQQPISKHGTVVFPHPPHFSDLASCDICIFLQKDQLKGYSRM
jgi:hypothetical protein